MDKLYVEDTLIESLEKRCKGNPYSLEFSKKDVIIRDGTHIIDYIKSNGLDTEYMTSNIEKSIRNFEKSKLRARRIRRILYVTVVCLGILAILILNKIGGEYNGSKVTEHGRSVYYTGSNT